MRVLHILMVFTTYFCFGQQALDLAALKQQEIAVTYPYAEILVDTHAAYNSRTILESSLRFEKFLKGRSSTEETQSYWVRNSIKASKGTRWFLEAPDPHINKLTFYQLKQGVLIPMDSTSGFGLPFNKKGHYYKNFLFSLESSHEPVMYYLHYETRMVNSLALRVVPEPFFIKYSLTEYYLLGAYYGLLLMMALYNFAIFLRVKERIYLLYVLYVMCCALNSFSEDGLGFQFIWPNYPKINLWMMHWVPDLLMCSFLMYSISFLNIYKDFKWLVWLASLLAMTHVVCNYINFAYYLGKLNLSPLFLSSFALIYIVGIYKSSKGNKSARYFIAGYSFILLSLVVFYLRTQGITIMHHLVTIYSFNIGFLIEVIVLSYALGERLRTEKLEKEQAQQKTIGQLKENEKIRAEYTKQLEKEVEARTQDLRLANEEIKKFNEFLKDKNLKLELDVRNISKERVTSKLMSLQDFKNIYEDELICKEYLHNRKWKSKPYKCSKCGSDKDIAYEDYSKRCAKCKYVESATANTIFHGVKIALPEAFYMLYAVFTNKSITAEELSAMTGVSERSCSVFKKKIQDTEKSVKGKTKKTGWEHLIDITL